MNVKELSVRERFLVRKVFNSRVRASAMPNWQVRRRFTALRKTKMYRMLNSEYIPSSVYMKLLFSVLSSNDANKRSYFEALRLVTTEKFIKDMDDSQILFEMLKEDL